MKTRKPKSEQSRQLISRTMKKRWAERKERQKLAEQQHAATVRADYWRRKKAGLLTPEELERERQQMDHKKKLQRRYERESKRNGMLRVIRDELATKKVVSRGHAFALAARYLQKMYLTSREEQCIIKYMENWNSKRS
jgi:hypothetical protein